MARPRLEQGEWWSELVGLSDELGIGELAERFGVSRRGLRRAMLRTGLLQEPSPPSALVSGRTPDPRSAEAQPWWPEFLKLKDRRTLAQLARRFSVSQLTLSRAMKRTGTTRTAQRRGRNRKASRKLTLALAPLKDQLGQLSDAEVARQAGLSASQVARYRRARQIPSSRSRGLTGAGTESTSSMGQAAARTPGPGASGQHAFLVGASMGERSVRFVVVAKDLAQAARLAPSRLQARHGSDEEGWQLDRVELVAPLL